MNYVLSVFALAVLATLLYTSAFLCIGFTWRWQGLGGCVLGAVAAIHLMQYLRSVWRDGLA